MVMDRLLTPEPVVKKLTTKSSMDMVSAITKPENTPGMISGRITLKKPCIGVAPRSCAASARFGSIWRSLGITLSTT